MSAAMSADGRCSDGDDGNVEHNAKLRERERMDDSRARANLRLGGQRDGGGGGNVGDDDARWPSYAARVRALALAG